MYLVMRYSKSSFLSTLVVASLMLSGCGGKEASIPDAPDAAVKKISSELSAANGGILWEAMPETYRADVNEIVHLAGTKVDAEVYDKTFALVDQLVAVADKQKEFIFNTGMVKQGNAEDIESLKSAWPSMMGFFKSITESSIASSEGLKTFDGQAFCEVTISKLIGHALEMNKYSKDEMPLEEYLNTTVKTLSNSETEATLELTAVGGAVTVQDFLKIENRWVPSDIASEWTSQVEEIKTNLAAFTPEKMNQNKPQIMGMITMLEGVLSQIETAQTQEQFDQAIQSSMGSLMGLMMMQQSFGGSQ